MYFTITKPKIRATIIEIIVIIKLNLKMKFWIIKSKIQTSAPKPINLSKTKSLKSFFKSQL